ncbi:MAG: sulfur carrier protein ThiS [Verrucomicrobiota bacterium]
MSESGLKTIWLNGEQKETAAQNIRDLISSLGLPAASLLVEHNGLALRRDEWPQCRIAGGDRVEVVRIVAGG